MLIERVPLHLYNASTIVKMGAVVLLKNNTDIAAIIILVEDLCQPNLIKAVKEVMRWMCLSW